MRLQLSLLLFFVMVPTILPQQQPSAALSTSVSNQEWEIDDWSAIRRGQVSIIHARKGDELHLYVLGTGLPSHSPSPVVSQRPDFSGNCFQVSSFDLGNTNRLGGYFNVFRKEPSSARASLQAGPDGRRGLTLDFLKTPSGFCGVWTHLFDFKLPAESRRYLDATSFSLLTFWIRGQSGTERILLKASDARWERLGDAQPVGEAAAFLAQGSLSSAWQRAVVPLSRFPSRLDRRELASLVFEALGSGAGQVQIKDLAFCADPSPLPELSPPVMIQRNAKPRHQALWVWNTAEILASKEVQQDLLRFLPRHGFTRIFLQLPEGKSRGGVPGEITLDAEKLRPLLASLNLGGVAVSALDGFKNYALPEWHDGVLRTVENIIRYNRESEPSERFAGIHYDVEPYLIKGFGGPRRQTFLQAYLELLEKIAGKTKPSQTPFGVDIPFWYDAADELTGKPVSILFRGAAKPASEHVIDLVDEVAIMDYRTAAYGADGVIAMAQDELAYASKQGKPVFIGLETTELPDEELLEFSGVPSGELHRRVPNSRFVVMVPAPIAAKLYVVSPAQWPALRGELESNGINLASLLWWPIRTATLVPGHKLTFSGLGVSQLRQTMAEAQAELGQFSSFAGFALHDYLGYRRLLKSAETSLSQTRE
jgi:hypothetical protein